MWAARREFAPDIASAPAFVIPWRVAVFELAYATLQAARAEASHCNTSDTLRFALYGLMGLAAILMLTTKARLAVEIARNPVAGLDPVLRCATGLWITVILGAVTGICMSQQFVHGHNVGATGGTAPFFGWNRAGGDLRVAHFFTIHAEQALPLLAWAGAGLAMATRNRLVTIAAAAIAALTIAVFAQAIAGRPFPF